MSARPYVDPTNLLHQASYYVETAKYGEREGRLEAVTIEELTDQYATFIDAIGLDMTPSQMAEAVDYYVHSLSTSLMVRPVLARTIFVDGLLHGMALAGGLRGEPREPKL